MLRSPKRVADAGTAAATHFEHSRSWIAGSISCKRFELSAAVERLQCFEQIPVKSGGAQWEKLSVVWRTRKAEGTDELHGKRIV